MADKEPRRRKKRRESQKKESTKIRKRISFEDEIEDDNHGEDHTHFFTSFKSESRDSDQDTEEETVSHSNHHSQPSNVAKFVFVILFSGLVASLSFIFTSLRDADRGPVDIFDAEHEHHAEVLHNTHVEDALYNHDHHQESKGLTSVFSINNDQVTVETSEPVKEDESPAIPSAVKVEANDDDIPPEITADQGILEEYIEITSIESIEEVEPLSPELYLETTASNLNAEEIVPDASYSEETFTEASYSEESFSEEHSTPPYSIADDFVTPYMPSENIESTGDSLNYDETTSSYDNIDEQEDILLMYERADITNEADYEIRGQIDELDGIVNKSPDRALAKCQELLQAYPESPRLHYLKSQALDNLAEIHHSNKYLEEAIAAYQKSMACKNVPEKLYLLAGKRTADRLRFRGFTGKYVKLLTEMSDKFPLDVGLKNQVAVGYLLIGQNKFAKKLLQEVLKMAPDSGVAKVHLGFILKTDESNYEESIKYLSEGIATREPGVIDGRFYFHWGDALHRIGKKKEALEVYTAAVKEGLFLSVYQRSLYNVDNLTGKPWWNPNSTLYAPDIKLLEKNWATIRNEALSLINEKYSGFLSENEGLQEKGDWKQLELFSRGRKIEKNCQKALKTCSLISQIPDAATCKRGQVKFSIMNPGTHVWAHTGPTNCRLRAHLGLVVPEGASIRVADDTRKWEEGKVILFDDSFEHEVWHNGSMYRLILIVDFWHPELSSYQKRSLTPI